MIRPLLSSLALLGLSACAVHTTPKPSNSGQVRPTPSQPEIVVTAVPEIIVFAPTRGEQSVYTLNESIRFQVRTTQGGYLTLTAYGPDNVVSVFAQGVFVEGNVDTVLPTAESGVRYDLAPPRGLQRVTATLSSDPSGVTTLDTAASTFYIQ
jgi:hypothetical protein